VLEERVLREEERGAEWGTCDSGRCAWACALSWARGDWERGGGLLLRPLGRVLRCTPCAPLRLRCGGGGPREVPRRRLQAPLGDAFEGEGKLGGPLVVSLRLQHRAEDHWPHSGTTEARASTPNRGCAGGPLCPLRPLPVPL